MAVEWQGRTPVHVGDTVGNPVTLLIGVVKVGKRVTVGFQRADELPDRDLPNYTLDTMAIDDMVKTLLAKRKELAQVTGTL